MYALYLSGTSGDRGREFLDGTGLWRHQGQSTTLSLIFSTIYIAAMAFRNVLS